MLSHRAARQEDEQIHCQIAGHQQRYGRAGHNSSAERRNAHHFDQHGFVDIVSDFRWKFTG